MLFQSPPDAYAVSMHSTINTEKLSLAMEDVVGAWRNGRASDLQSEGCEFDPQPVRGCVTTLGKLFTSAALTLTLFVSIIL